MRVPQLGGRLVTTGDRDNSTRVAIVSESIASHYFARKDIGKRVIIPEFKFNIEDPALPLNNSQTGRLHA
jgi:hypothetical protein